MKISDALHEAADNHLWDGIGFDTWGSGYSCFAVDDALRKLAVHHTVEQSIFKGLEEMGVDIERTDQFDEFPEGEQRQAARYNWLKFAAMIAEEQGV